jgi:hypothetical protein
VEANGTGILNGLRGTSFNYQGNRPPNDNFVLFVHNVLISYNGFEVIAMIGVETKNINDVRASFAAVMQKAARSSEIICRNGKRNDAEAVSIIATHVLDDILTAYTFSPEFYQANETSDFEVALTELNLYAYAATKEEALENLLDLAEDYVTDFLADVEKYRRFPKQRKHYPYILRLAHAEGREAMRGLIFDGDR